MAYATAVVLGYRNITRWQRIESPPPTHKGGCSHDHPPTNRDDIEWLRENKMRYLSLFSGIEAATQAWHNLGWEPVAFAEIDKFACEVLSHHYPSVPNLGSVINISEEDLAALGKLDLVVGGSPCQDLSVAGKRKGMKGERSSLFFHQMRIFNAARHLCGARFCLWENVPGVFGINGGRDFAEVVGAMAGAEFGVPKNGWKTAGAAVGRNGLVEWRVLDTQYVRTRRYPAAIPQRRRRVYALLDTGDWSSRPPILFDAESLRGNPPPRREAGEGTTHSVAPCTGASGRGFERAGETRGQDPVVAQILKAEGFDASEDGTGRGTPFVPGWTPEVAPTLNAHFGDKMGLENQHALSGAGLFQPVAFHNRQDPDISGDVTHPLGRMDNGMAIAFEEGQDQPAPGTMQVRRLTVEECELLMGFPRGFTRISWRGKKPENCPTGLRYKALGNSMAVNCMEWIGRRIVELDR